MNSVNRLLACGVQHLAESVSSAVAELLAELGNKTPLL